MIDPQDERLSLVRQCALVGIARSSYYYRPVGESRTNLRLMRLIDELHLNCPWYGSRQMARVLRRRGHRVGRKRVRRLMRVMGLRSLAPRPNTSRRAPGHRVYPYLLRDLEVQRPNQAWCADLTYVPMAHGFLYLVAIMDWHSRKVLSWGLSTTQDTVFCVHAPAGRHRALRRAGGVQHRPGQPVHVHGVDRGAGRARHPDLHGRQGPVERQRVHRAAVALAEVRVRVPAGVRRFRRGPRRDRRVGELLQRRAPALGVRRSDAGGGARWRPMAGPGGLRRRCRDRRGYRTGGRTLGACRAPRAVDLWTSPTDRREPCGPCGQPLGNAPALPTA